AALAADGDDERVSRRRRCGRLAGRDRKPGLFRARRRPLALSLRRRSAPAMNRRFSSGLAALHPAYFALVMATGIISISCHLLQIPLIDRVLLWLNCAFFVALWTLTLLRVALFPERVRADVLHHGRAVGFFTSVAGTCELGSQWLIVGS